MEKQPEPFNNVHDKPLLWWVWRQALPEGEGALPPIPPAPGSSTAHPLLISTNQLMQVSCLFVQHLHHYIDTFLRYLFVFRFPYLAPEMVTSLFISSIADVVTFTWMVDPSTHNVSASLFAYKPFLSASPSVLKTCSDRIPNLAQHHWQFYGGNYQRNDLYVQGCGSRSLLVHSSCY